ncbi:MAG: type II toxin-antitoxin system Phd/YefM family antitoxin [Thermomicrobiales bacterium]
MALPKQPTTETMSVSESRKQYSEILNRVFLDDERIVIEKNGIPIAAIVPLSVVRDAEEKQRWRESLLQAWHDAQPGFVGVDEEEAEREIAEALDEIERESEKVVAVARGAEMTPPKREAALESFHRVQQAFADVPEDELERELEKALAEAKDIQLAKRSAKAHSEDVL